MSLPPPREHFKTDAEYDAARTAAARAHEQMKKTMESMNRTPTTPRRLDPPPPPRTTTPTTARTTTPTTARTPTTRTPTTARTTTTPTTARTTTPTTARTTTPSGPPEPSPVRSDYKIPLKMQLPAKEPTPIKRAAGGAAKVRKDMMSPEGKILHAMNKLRGK